VATAGLTLPAGFTGERLPYQFQNPTQFTVQGEYLYVAQLNGGENERLGQIIGINLNDGSRSILADGLDKPTGLAVLDNVLWIATRDAVLRLRLDGVSSLETILEDLPNNGRSNGTLTVTNRGTLLYETSGNRRDADSGKLWELDPETLETQVVASGLKGAYAHAVTADGRIWLTEIADGQVNGVTLPDELNLLLPGADFGWPRCYGRELAGPDCTDVRPAVATFAPHSTPTSVVVSPFATDTLLVALWLRGEVVQLPITHVGDNAVSEPEPFLSGFNKPQHLLIQPDGSLWVSDFADGRIYRIWQP
jgi:glucose/arabinose dehydrogenase